MALISDAAFDQALSYIQTNGTRLDICSAEPTTFTEATSTFTLGNDTVTTGAPQDNGTIGRKVQVPAITAGSVTGTGTASHWGLNNGTALLPSAGSLSATQSVTSGNSFTLDAIDITLLDAT